MTRLKERGSGSAVGVGTTVVGADAGGSIAIA